MQRRWEDLTGKLSCTFLASRMLFEEVFQLKDVMVKSDGNSLTCHGEFVVLVGTELGRGGKLCGYDYEFGD